MIARLPRHRMIPRHDLGVPLREYGPYLRGPLVRDAGPERFAGLWSELLPRQRVVPTPLGRHALWYFLDAAGLQPGDEVLVAAYNYYVVVRVLVQKGLVPVFVDVDPDTLCMDPEDLARKIGPRARMVLVTHMFGHPADLDAIEASCRAHGLLLFEDCAHAIGTTIPGEQGDEQVGNRGDGALFSFGIWKIVGTFGGGMLALRPELHAKLAPTPHAGGWMQAATSLGSRAMIAQLMRPGLYGWFIEPILQVAWRRAARGRTGLRDLIAPSKDNAEWRFDEHDRSPYRPFMTAMLAAQLARLDAQVRARRAAVEGLERRVAELDGVRRLDRDRHGRSNGAYLGLWVPDPEALAGALARAGVGTNPHEFFDCSRLPQFADFAATCPRAAEACDHVIRMPSYAALREADLDFMAAALAEHLEAPR